MMARVAAWGTGLLATLAVPAVLVLLARLHGAEALLALPPAEMAVLVMGLFLPPALLLLTVAGLVQRVELVALRNAVLRHATSFDSKSLAAETLIEECRNQTALLQEQVRLAISALAIGQRQVETVQHAAAETRMQRLVAEWDMVTVELSVTLTAMWRLVHGWRAPAPRAARSCRCRPRASCRSASSACCPPRRTRWRGSRWTSASSANPPATAPPSRRFWTGRPKPARSAARPSGT
jgi:hypothetical protein